MSGETIREIGGQRVRLVKAEGPLLADPRIVGDELAATSETLAAFVREAECGSSLWFAVDLEELERRLSG